MINIHHYFCFCFTFRVPCVTMGLSLYLYKTEILTPISLCCHGVVFQVQSGEEVVLCSLCCAEEGYLFHVALDK